MFRKLLLAASLFCFSGAALATETPPHPFVASCSGNVTFDCLLADLPARIDAESMTTQTQAMGLANAAMLAARYGSDETRKDMLYKYDQLPRKLEPSDSKTIEPARTENHFAFYRAQLLFSLGKYEEALALLRAMKEKDLAFDKRFLPQFFAVETLVQAGKLDDAIRLVKDTGHMQFKSRKANANGDGAAEWPDGKPAEQLIEALLVAGRVKDAEEFYNYLAEDDLFMTDPHQLGALFARYYEKESTPENKEKQTRFCAAVADQLTWPENRKAGSEGVNHEFQLLVTVLLKSHCFKNDPGLLEKIDTEKMPVEKSTRENILAVKDGKWQPKEKMPIPPPPALKAGVDDCVTKAGRDHNYYVPCMARLLDEHARAMEAQKASEFDEKYPPFGQ